MERLFIFLIIVALLVPAYYGPIDNVQVTAFVSPDNSFQVIQSFLNNATSFVYLAVYTFSNPRLLKTINDLVSRGVSVYVLLEDHHVSYFEDKYTLWAAYNLTEAGAHVRRAPTTYNYMHAKYIVIDNSSVLVFTGNMAKSSVPYDPSAGNRERGVIIREASIAKYFSGIFLKDRSSGTPYDASQGTGEPVSDYVEHGSYPHPFGAVSDVARVEAFAIPEDDAVSKYVSLINSATTSIEVEIAYAEMWRSGIDAINPLITALVSAAARGVTVRVIIGFYSDEQESLALYLRDHGVWVARGPSETNAETFPVDSYFSAIHTKTMIIDGHIVVISSANRSENAFNNNREVGVIIYSNTIADYFKDVFERDRSHSYVMAPLQYAYVSFITPGNGSVLTSPVMVKLAVNSTLNGTLSLYANGELKTTDYFSRGYHVFNYSLNLEPGEYNLTAIVIAGEYTDKETVFIKVVENDFVHVDVLSPSNGSVIFGVLNMTIAVNASKSGTLYVYVNDTIAYEHDFYAGYSVFNISIVLDSGKYVIKLVASIGELNYTCKLYLSIESEEEEGGGIEKIDYKVYRELVVIIVLAAIIRYLKRKKR